MTVAELIDYLGQYDEDHEIRIAYQPAYPLAGNIASVIAECDIEFEDDDGEHFLLRAPSERPIVWIAADSYYDEPYAPHGAWQAS